MDISEEIKILQVDDDEIDVRMAKRVLANSSHPAKFSVESVGNLAAATDCLGNDGKFDIVLLDLGLPDSSGIESVQTLRKINPLIPIVVLTGMEDEQVGLKAIKNGAADYLIKGPALKDLLVRTILYALERKKASENLRRSEERFQLVARATNDVIWDWNLQTNKVWRSENAQTLFGYSADEIGDDNKWWEDKLHPEDKQKVISGVLNFINSGMQSWSDEYRFRRKDDTYAIIFDRSFVIHDNTNRPIRVIGSMVDVTERKKAENERRLAEEKYRMIFENSAVAITMADEHERILSWNKFTEDLLDMSKEDLYFRPIKTLYPPEEWGKIRNNDVRQKGMQHHLETKMMKKDGEIIDVDVSLSVLRDSEDKVKGSIGVIRDITERVKAEEERKKAMEVKSQFISTVSHELRTPLTIIKEDIAIILDGVAGKVNKKQKEVLEMAQRNIDRLARLINDVLDFQKLDSGRAKFNMQENDINEIIKGVHTTMDITLKKKGLDFVLELDDNMSTAIFDSDKMVQVLTNLVSNAMKFTKTGSITIKTQARGNTILVSVVDTGCGIKEEDIPRLFHKFQQLTDGKTRTPGGTGLGLAISKEIIQQHGGKIWVESEFGKGTTFHFLLPVKERRQAMSLIKS